MSQLIAVKANFKTDQATGLKRASVEGQIPLVTFADVSDIINSQDPNLATTKDWVTELIRAAQTNEFKAYCGENKHIVVAAEVPETAYSIATLVENFLSTGSSGSAIDDEAIAAFSKFFVDQRTLQKSVAAATNGATIFVGILKNSTQVRSQQLKHQQYLDVISDFMAKAGDLCNEHATALDTIIRRLDLWISKANNAQDADL